MIIIYILLIVLGALPLWKTIRYIRLEERIRKIGVSSTGVVTNILTSRYSRNAAKTDRVQVQYQCRIHGQFHHANITEFHGKYKMGDHVPVLYLPEQPSKIVVSRKRGYWLMLIFGILILLFMVFAVYKIDEMIEQGNFKNIEFKI